MTPTVAAKLTIHEPQAAVRGRADRDAEDQSGDVIALPARTWGLVGDERSTASPVRRDALHRRLLCAADVLAAALALVLVLTLMGSDRPGLATLAGAPVVILLFKVAGLYDRDQLRLVHSTLDEAPLLAQLAGLYALAVTILQPVIVDGNLSAGQVAALWLISFTAILTGRIVARSLAGRASGSERCLVIGDPWLADRIREKLKTSHARAVVAATLPLEADEVDRLEGPDGVRRIVNTLGVDRIIIAPTTSDASGVAELIRIAKAAGVQVSVLPRMLEVVGSAVELEDIDGLTMLGVRPFGLSRSSRLLKRAFDVVTTGIGLIFVGPVIATIALAIRLDSKGPVFFRQVRVGRNGRHFRIYKFRSMIVNAEEQKDRLRSLNEVGDGMFKITHDPRVTRVGALLRRTSLDELPQLFNVMRGEMSLVGPRPLVTDEDALVFGLDRSRLHLTPGMTGPWQVLGSRVPMQEMVGIDYLYVANWTLWLDLKLLLRTVRHVLHLGNV
jgi:exopolysaccharide biosynthesis polyprenyl glycosylphosphotransferase